MEKRNNVLVVIFVITTIIAGCVAVYLGLALNKSKQEVDLANNTVKNISNSIPNELDISNKNETVSEITKTSSVQKLSQTNIDKIAQTTIEKAVNLTGEFFASPEKSLITLGFYSSYADFGNNTTNENGVQKTSVKYDEFINKVTKYISKEFFDEHYLNKIFKNENGYLAIMAGGASGSHYYINEINLVSNQGDVYTYEVKYIIMDNQKNVSDEQTQQFEVTKTGEEFVVTKGINSKI